MWNCAHMQHPWQKAYPGSTLPGTPRHSSTPRSRRTSHHTSNIRKHVLTIVVCFCIAVALWNCLLVPVRSPGRIIAINTTSNDDIGHTSIIKAAIEALDIASAATDPAEPISSSSSTTSSSRLHSMLHLAAGTAAASHYSAQYSINQAETGLRQAVLMLEAAGVQLDGVQQMQLDRMRMQAELYVSGRLQQRQTELETELRAAAAAAAAAAGSAAADSTQQLQNSSSSSSSMRKDIYSRGILIVAGSSSQMANAMVSIIILRHVLNCTLPIELVYYSTDEQDPVMMKFLQKYISSEGPEVAKLQIINGSAKHLDLDYHYQSWGSSSGRATGVSAANGIAGFAAKAHALAYITSFQQVMLLDADSLPLRNPTELFDSEPFVTHGNLFWPDFWKKMWIKEDFYKKLVQEVPWEVDETFSSAESGQVLIDRLQHVDMLEWLWWLNSHNNITYANMHGDKDTYRLAFALANKAAEYQQVKMPPRDAMSVVNGTATIRGTAYVHQGMVQHTPDGKPAFLHRTDKAKLFPYCAGKIDASVCQVKYFTIPLTEAQAMLAMRRGLAYTPTEADIRSYPGKCRSNMLVNPDRPDDPHRCALNEGLNLQPVPLIPVSEFKNVNSVLQASYAVFEQLRTLLVVGQKLQYMQLQQLGEHQRAAADKHSSSSAAVHRGQSLDAAAVYGPIVRSKQAFQVQ